MALATASGDTALVEVRREYAPRAVMQRLHQQQFRRLMLGAYREQCSICCRRHVELLDAAHILPDRDPRGEPVVTNGLGLCKIHRSAYDAHILASIRMRSFTCARSSGRIAASSRSGSSDSGRCSVRGERVYLR